LFILDPSGSSNDAGHLWGHPEGGKLGALRPSYGGRIVAGLGARRTQQLTQELVDVVAKPLAIHVHHAERKTSFYQETSFFPYFAYDGGLQRLGRLHATARQGPCSQVGRTTSLYEKHGTVLLQDDGSHSNDGIRPHVLHPCPMHPLRSPIVIPLKEDWREILDRIARSRGWPTPQEPSRLGALVAKLSKAYNAGDKGGMRSQDALAARLSFSFPRDVPKSAGAVRELVAAGALTIPEERPLSVLDLGAGLGASTWGVAMALEACRPGARGRIDAVCVDDDEAALSLATEIAESRRGQGNIEVRLNPIRASVSRLPRISDGPFDVVLLGQVLSELDATTEDRKLALSLRVLRSAIDLAAPDGSVVLVEPALRDRTRRLHALRDAILAAPDGSLAVFAPCLHQAPCPARSNEEAWCHEDLDVDLPRWLVPVASAAGLRWQGLTFSYLVLRRDGRTLRQERPASSNLVRVVSEAIVTKGKREAFVCGDLDANGARVADRARLMRLDRDASEANAAWEEASRGDTLEVVSPIDVGRPRIARDTLLRITTLARKRE